MTKKGVPDLSGGASEHGTIVTSWTCQQLHPGSTNAGYFLTAPAETEEDSEDE